MYHRTYSENSSESSPVYRQKNHINNKNFNYTDSESSDEEMYWGGLSEPKHNDAESVKDTRSLNKKSTKLIPKHKSSKSNTSYETSKKDDDYFQPKDFQFKFIREKNPASSKMSDDLKNVFNKRWMDEHFSKTFEEVKSEINKLNLNRKQDKSKSKR
ncbi:hypothetical protein PGB90_010631 [Kerria lacca]